MSKLKYSFIFFNYIRKERQEEIKVKLMWRKKTAK